MNPSTEQMQKSAQGMMQIMEEMGSMACESMDAMMQSAAAMTKGSDEIAQSTKGIVQESMSRAISAGKTMMGAKTVKEMMDMQAEFMKECFDFMMSGSGRVAEISARVAKEAIDPVAQHANNAMGKMATKMRAA